MFPTGYFPSETHSEKNFRTTYLPPAPQAEPHATGFSSGLSDAPQAEPHAAGFSSGLSDAPQAEPALFPFHSVKLESAMVITSI